MTGGSHSEGFHPTNESCEEIYFTASIASPNPQIVSLLTKDAILQVDLRESEGRTFIALLYKNEVAGSIIEQASRLAKCIREGFSFEAKVLSIHGGKIEISVSAL